MADKGKLPQGWNRVNAVPQGWNRVNAVPQGWNHIEENKKTVRKVKTPDEQAGNMHNNEAVAPETIVIQTEHTEASQIEPKAKVPAVTVHDKRHRKAIIIAGLAAVFTVAAAAVFIFINRKNNIKENSGSDVLDNSTIAYETWENVTDYTEVSSDRYETDTESTEAETKSEDDTTSAEETQNSTEADTEARTEAPTEARTEATTEARTEATTEARTEAATEVPTEAATEVPTEAHTEAPTEEVMEPIEGLTGNLKWQYYQDSKTLVISGEGAMKNYYYATSDTSIIPWYNFSHDIKNVTIKSGVTSIGEYAFLNCSSLTSITIPKGVTSIGLGAFYGCRSLTSITIPKGVTSIGLVAFYGCSSLTSITIPTSVTSIGKYVFYNCSSLTIHAPAGSYAESYATREGIPFVAE